LFPESPSVPEYLYFLGVLQKDRLYLEDLFDLEFLWSLGFLPLYYLVHPYDLGPQLLQKFL
jgi:hypothetical protein